MYFVSKESGVTTCEHSYNSFIALHYVRIYHDQALRCTIGLSLLSWDISFRNVYCRNSFYHSLW